MSILCNTRKSRLFSLHSVLSPGLRGLIYITTGSAKSICGFLCDSWLPLLYLSCLPIRAIILWLLSSEICEDEQKNKSAGEKFDFHWRYLEAEVCWMWRQERGVRKRLGGGCIPRGVNESAEWTFHSMTLMIKLTWTQHCAWHSGLCDLAQVAGLEHLACKNRLITEPASKLTITE